jgi:hypothetical protein
MASASPASPVSALLIAMTNGESSQDELTPEDEEEVATESRSPEGSEDHNELCELCRSLNIEYLVSDHGGKGKSYDLDVLIHFASHCKICDRLFNLRGLTDLEGRDCNHSIFVSFSIHQTDSGCYGDLEVYPDYLDYAIPDYYEPIARHAIYTNEGDVASTRHGLLTLQTMGANTSSDRSFSKAQEWLNSCTHGHPGRVPSRPRHFRTVFGEPKFESSNGPARLIDIFADGDLSGLGRCSRILDGVEVRSLNKYTALSYQWGSRPYQGYITTKANLVARKAGIVEDELPKTFRHAIYIARRLGVRYLWIDAVCIVQDCGEDWLKESSKMGSIFANALLTLVAAGSEDSELGMFNDRSTYGGCHPDWVKAADEKCPAFRTTLPGGTVRSTLYILDHDSSCHMFLRSHVRDGPLMSRAWCFQEDYLSARKLYYARDQLYWHCDHLATSEDGLVDPDVSFFTSCSFLDTTEECEVSWSASHYWYTCLVTDYSRRKITKATDWLIAVAGLARHVATMVDSRYLAGLWEISVFEGLLWRPCRRGQVRLSPVPSWSWASRLSPMEFQRLPRSEFENTVPGCEYVRADIKLLSDDEYGGVSSAVLTLRSRVVEITMKGDHSVDAYHGSHRGVGGWAHMDANEICADAKYFAIPIRLEKSLLVAKNLGSNTHRRVGIWEIPRENSFYHFDHFSRPVESWDCPASFLRWTDQVLPTTPITEIEII